jgi:hypothetical protein
MVKALYVIRTGCVDVAIVEVLSGFEDLIFSKSRQQCVAQDFGRTVAMSADHEHSNDIGVRLGGDNHRQDLIFNMMAN